MKTLQNIFECQFFVTKSRTAVKQMSAWASRPTEEAMHFDLTERLMAFEKEMVKLKALKDGPLRWAPPPWKYAEYKNYLKQQALSDTFFEFEEKNRTKKSRTFVAQIVEDVPEPQATTVATENESSVSPSVSLTGGALDSSTSTATPVLRAESAPLKDVETAPKKSQDDDKSAFDYSDSKNYDSLRKYIAEAELEIRLQNQMFRNQKKYWH